MTLSGTARGAEFETTAPEGFESLMEPQTALVDVHFQNRNLGSFLASFAPGWLEFEAPGAIVDEMSGLSKPDAVADALSGRLSSNAKRLCRGGQQDCGFVETDAAAILFDRSSFRVDIFVAPEMLEQESFEPRFIAPPPNDVSVLQSFSGAAAGGDGDDTANLRSFTLIGRGPARLRAESSFSTRDGASLDEMLGEMERRQWRYQTGLFRAPLLPIIGDRRFLGIGTTTTTETRLDIDEAGGTPLTVFLPSRARVEILRDGRILSTQFLEPGQRRLDTRSLPRGAYQVTLRINLTGGGVREEVRFFAKDQQVPPPDQPRYVLQAGLLASDAGSGLPELGHQPFVHAGTSHRLGDTLALGADLVANADEAAAELSGILLTRYSRVRASAFASSEMEGGVSLRAFGSFDRLSYSTRLRQLWTSRNGSASADRDIDDLVDVGRGSTELDLTLDYALPGGPQLGIRGFLNANKGAPDTYAVGPRIFWPLYAAGGLRIDLSAEASFTDTQTLTFAQLRFSRAGTATTSSAVTGYRGGDDRSAIANAQTTWHAVNNRRRRLDLSVGGDLGPDRTVRAGADYQGPIGRLNFEANRDFDSHTTRYGANFGLSGAGNAEAIALTGGEGARSAIIVATEGDGDTRFEVLVDGRPQAEIGIGERTAVDVQPYDVYNVRLRRVSGNFVDYDTAERVVSVWPGTTRTLAWETAPIVAVFGKAVRPGGEALKNAAVSGGRQRVTTDDNGFFLVEVGTTESLVIQPGQPDACRIDLPDFEVGAEFRDLGQVTCTRTD